MIRSQSLLIVYIYIFFRTASVVGGLDQNVFDRSVNEDYFGEEVEIDAVIYYTKN